LPLTSRQLRDSGGAWNVRPTAAAGGRVVAGFAAGMVQWDIVFPTRITITPPIHSPLRAHRGLLPRIPHPRRTDSAERFADVVAQQRARLRHHLLCACCGEVCWWEIAVGGWNRCSVGPRGVGAWRLFDSLRWPHQSRHHHDAEADDNSDGYHCDFHCRNWLPLRTDITRPKEIARARR
jgi:hypothetical protein